MRMKQAKVRLLAAAMVGLMASAALAAVPPPVGVTYSGNLVADPCTLLQEDENIALDFGTVIDKYLYLNGRTHGQTFRLHLMNCDISLGQTLKITFSGVESIALPGLLAIDGSSEATGIAIGLETPESQPLPINIEGGKYGFKDGNNSIVFQAYVRGEPKAIADKTIGRGPFNAVATFNLEYD